MPDVTFVHWSSKLDVSVCNLSVVLDMTFFDGSSGWFKCLLSIHHARWDFPQPVQQAGWSYNLSAMLGIAFLNLSTKLNIFAVAVQYWINLFFLPLFSMLILKHVPAVSFFTGSGILWYVPAWCNYLQSLHHCDVDFLWSVQQACHKSLQSFAHASCNFL